MVIYIVVMSILSLALAYELSFVQATLYGGRAMSRGQMSTGDQDAITPPWSSPLGLLTYGACLLGLLVGVMVFSWFVGLAAAIGLYVGILLNKVLFMPKPRSDHVLRLIVASLSARLAHFVRDGDHPKRVSTDTAGEV